MKNTLLSIFFVFSSFITFSQITWDFNTTNGLQGWTPFRLTSSFTANSVILTTNGQNNPRLDHASAGVNADLYKYMVAKIKNPASGPNFLRINFGANIKARSISTGDTATQTYFFNMTDANWTGTINNLQVAFRTEDGSLGGTTYSSNGVPIEIEEISFIENPFIGLTELYVDPTNGNDNNIGSYSSPMKTIPAATNIASENSIANVYVKSGTYQFIPSINITTNSPHLITISPEPMGSVVLELIGYRGFRFFSGARNIEIKGFEINGKSNTLDHWTILSQYVWQPSTLSTNPLLAGGGIAVNVEEANDIKITENYFHDFYQKAVNINDGRYVTVKGNIIKNIALTSLSGGHGIMRQQGSGSFVDSDDPTKYRWDLDGNLIFNVHQRIYSWVPWKGFLNMTLDEGKPILIDETPDHDQNIKARIRNNIVAFNKIDAIRIKPTNNLEVSNNSVYTQDSDHGDGITDTTTGFNTANGTPFNNFICQNNAVQVLPSKFDYELGESMASTNALASNNYGAFGTINPSGVATNLNADLFVNPEIGDFNLKSGIPSTIGASLSTINDLAARTTLFNVDIANDNWEHDHLKNFQTLYDNVPGIEDGVVGNEPVFTDAGLYDLSDLEYARGRKAFYFALNPTWQTDNGVTSAVLNQRTELDAYDGKYEIIVPEDYSDWYDDIKATYLRDSDNNGSDDSPYDRIRYGESVIAQNKIFLNNSLQVVEIAASYDYTKTDATGYAITLDGDILIDFNYTPAGYETFDLITANTITSANATVLFDRIRMEGYTGTYTLEIVLGSPNILRLTLTNLPQPIIWKNAAWSNVTGPTATDNALIDDDFSTTATLECNDLTINENWNVTINPTHSLKVNGNLVNSGSIIFKSDATGTGRFDTFNGTISGNGKATVERFIAQGKRAYRLLTPAVSTTDYINSNWQQDTHITGSTTGANGFDATLTGNPSMFTYNNQVASGTGWNAIPNTNATKLNAGFGYRILIRGDRSTDIFSSSLPNMNAATTLSATGDLKYGNITFNASSTPAINNTTNTTTADFSLIGNPYVSPVNWNFVSKTGLTNTYYAWDPNMGTASQRGRYVAYNGTTNDNPSSEVNEFIQPGQAFFVKNSVSGTAGSITFAESNKANTFTDVFRTSSDLLAKMNVSLFNTSELNAGETYPIDATTTVFESSNANLLDVSDALKLESSGENIAWFIDNSKLAINAFSLPVANDELPIKTLRLATNKNYSFKIQSSNLDVSLSAFLIDNFAGTTTTFDLNTDFVYNFSTTSDANSTNENRFKVVFNAALKTTDFSLNTVLLYPNPSNSDEGFTLFTNEISNIKVEIVNTLDQKIEFIKNNTNFKPTTKLQSGIYFVKIHTNSNEKTIKWIIK